MTPIELKELEIKIQQQRVAMWFLEDQYEKETGRTFIISKPLKNLRAELKKLEADND